MSYTVDYGALDNIMNIYNTVLAEWNNGISTVLAKKDVIANSRNISGNKADRMKEYLNSAYSQVNVSLGGLLLKFKDSFLVYIDDYYHYIDSDISTHIEEKEISTVRADIQRKRSELQGIGLSAENTVKGISDLVALPNLDLSKPDAEIGRVLTYLDEVDNDINSLESKHSVADFTEIDAMIDKVSAYLKELIGFGREYKFAFDKGRFEMLKSVSNLTMATHEMISGMKNQMDAVARAEDNLMERIKQQQTERERREKQTEWVKTGLSVAIGAMSAAALVIAGPAGAIVVRTVASAASATIGAAADEYVEHGINVQDWNTNQITIHGCVGAVTGMVSCLIPPGVGTCTKATISAVSSAFAETANESYSQLEMYGGIKDVKAIGEKAFSKGVSTFAGYMVGDAVEESIKTDEFIGFYSQKAVSGEKHLISKLEIDVTGEIAKGATKRFSSTAVTETIGLAESMAEGKSFAEAYEEHDVFSESVQSALAPSEIAGDALDATVKVTAEEYGRDIDDKTSWIRTSLTPENEAFLQQMERDGEFEGVNANANLHNKVDSTVGYSASILSDDALESDEVYASLYKLENRTDDYYIFGDSPDLNGNASGWHDWDSEEYDRFNNKLAEMENQRERSFKSTRSKAVSDAWAAEKRLVMQGRGTRDWSVSQQEELIRTGKVTGFDGNHMLSASQNPSEAGNPDNIQFLTYEEHIYGAHGGKTTVPTTGRFDPTTGETTTINKGQIPHREKTAFEITDKYDYAQQDLAEWLGSDFGYGRGNKSK